MLFDLRGRGRRRAIKVIYGGLALLLGGGLVLFGIGGDVQGGLFDAFRENSGENAGQEQLERRVDALEERVAAEPRNAAAWAQLARTRFQTAEATEDVDPQTGQVVQTFTAAGRERLRQADVAWQRHLAIAGDDPDEDTAFVMRNAYLPNGLDMLDRAVQAQEVIIEESEDEPNSNLFAQLAQFAYQAGQDRKGDLAADRAVELAPEGERTQLRTALEQVKTMVAQQAAQEAAAQAPPAETGTQATPPASTGTQPAE